MTGPGRLPSATGSQALPPLRAPVWNVCLSGWRRTALYTLQNRVLWCRLKTQQDGRGDVCLIAQVSTILETTNQNA